MSNYPQPPYGQQPQAPPPGYPPQYGYPPQGGYMPPGGYAPVAGPTKTSGLAIAALCCALLVPAIGGLLGIILGILGLKDAKKPGKSGHGLALAGLIIGILNMVAIGGIAILVPTLDRVRAQANEIKTMSNLRQTATGVLMYQNTYRNKYPDSLDVLVTTDMAQAEMMKCVESDERFVYVKPVIPPGKSTVPDPASLVILYNPKGRLETGALLCGYADGHVESFRGPQADRMMSQLKASNMRPK